jgi:hypothetical protein
MAQRSGKEESFAEATREGASRMVIRQARRATQEERNDLLGPWLEQVEQARRRQEAGRSLARGPTNAYEDCLDSIFFYYGENARAAERATREG